LTSSPYEWIKIPPKAVVIHPHISFPDRAGNLQTEASRHPSARLQEAISLAQALDLEIVCSALINIKKIRSATLIGQGKVNEIVEIVRNLDAEVVIIDTPLSPAQQRNLERAWDVKVLDRTGLILEIFANRAETREGRLQVELAQLTYQKSRLVRSWTHLERQRGGFGFVGGPGETQIEADRRMIQERIISLSSDLNAVKRTRALHRSARAKVPYPIVALVGYTNAGKSSLFNQMTDAGATTKDMLFATLDPKMRRLKLPHGTNVILSDTVGFVSDLPTHLVAAFRATLEEVINADLIIHVRDITHPDTQAQALDVKQIMQSLFDERPSAPIIEVLNKIDLLTVDGRDKILVDGGHDNTIINQRIAISAITGEGTELLLEHIENALATFSTLFEIELEADRGRDIHWIYENCEVLERQEGKDGSINLAVRVPLARVNQFHRRVAELKN
jgi:GTP-binding protein HflX